MEERVSPRFLDETTAVPLSYSAANSLAMLSVVIAKQYTQRCSAESHV